MLEEFQGTRGANSAVNLKEMEEALTIGAVSRKLCLCADTLRIWEKKGLITPRRQGKNRIYTQADMKRLRTIKELLRDQGLNVAGVRKILEARAA